MNRFCGWVGVVHSYPMDKSMGCLPATDGEQATHDFNHGTGKLSLSPTPLTVLTVYQKDTLCN